MTRLKTDVLIIGGGVTGTGIARDLALRGVNCILVEQGDINAGASGRNHGLLHSGARYVSKDIDSAKSCRKEGELLKHLAPHCINNSGGLFVAVEGDDENFIADFPQFCQKCEVPVKKIDLREAHELEPTLSKKLIAAYEVQDGTIDPFRLSIENISQAQDLDSLLICRTKAIEFKVKNKKIVSTRLVNQNTGEEKTVDAACVVNAAGAWAGEIAKMAGITVSVLLSKGTLLITQTRITKRVINRLRPPSDGDILVPGGTVSVLGTTSTRVDTLDDIRPTIAEVDAMIEQGAAMIPSLETTRYMRAFSGVRPLISNGGDGDDRSVSRDLALFDHAENNVDNFITISGGKLTTYREMAEKTADIVCQKMGISKPCLTAVEPLAHSRKWSVPGISPKTWVQQNDSKDVLLCECEMVSESAVNQVIDHITVHNKKEVARIVDIGVRSRVGKGSCQGTFCGVRIAAHMYNEGKMAADQGLDNIREFLQERWQGQQPVFWGVQLSQAEMAEAIHCGFFGLELPL